MAKSSVYYKKVGNFLAQEHVQAYTMAILSFFALAFFTIVAIRPTMISFFELKKEIEDAKQTDKQLDKKINALLEAQNNYYQQLENIALLEQAIPNDPEFTALLKKIEDIVSTNNADIQAFQTIEEFDVIGEISNTKSNVGSAKNLQTSPMEQVSAIKYNLGLSSTYESGETVLKQLMNLRRILVLDTLKISLANESNPAQGVDVNMDAGAIYQSPFE